MAATIQGTKFSGSLPGRSGTVNASKIAAKNKYTRARNWAGSILVPNSFGIIGVHFLFSTAYKTIEIVLPNSPKNQGKKIDWYVVNILADSVPAESHNTIYLSRISYCNYTLVGCQVKRKNSAVQGSRNLKQ
jgi:hypothetical protein